MSGDKAEGRDIAPSINSEERPDLENYKSKYEGSSSTSNTVKTTDFDSVTTVPTPEGILNKMHTEVTKKKCWRIRQDYRVRGFTN